ncbi:MAG: hypothetical protein ABJL44_16950 [Algibacter sp.]
MLLTITLIITSLVLINLVLLKFSTNKVIKTKNKPKKPVILHPQVTYNNEDASLAPTGS